MNTREKIIDSTIRLCNEQGSHAVTTNHIIDDLKISPGTLYYHFKNKEVIIREIFKIITNEFTIIQKEDITGMDELLKMFRENYKIIYKYRFFYMEIYSLMKKDEVLRRLYRENYNLKIKSISEKIDRLSAEGLIKNLNKSNDIKRMIKNIWIVTDFWISFTEVSGENITEKAIDEGVKQIELLISPFMA